MSKALNKAILSRLNGTEALTGDAETARTRLVALLGQTPQGKPYVRYGSKGSSVAYPEVTFREDAGVVALNAEGIGICSQSVYRFEIWEDSRSGERIPDIADCLEMLLDGRRGAPEWTVEGSGQVYGSDLMTALQAPFYDERYDAYFGLIAFRFVEARP